MLIWCLIWQKKINVIDSNQLRLLKPDFKLKQIFGFFF